MMSLFHGFVVFAFESSLPLMRGRLDPDLVPKKTDAAPKSGSRAAGLDLSNQSHILRSSFSRCPAVEPRWHHPATYLRFLCCFLCASWSEIDPLCVLRSSFVRTTSEGAPKNNTIAVFRGLPIYMLTTHNGLPYYTSGQALRGLDVDTTRGARFVGVSRNTAVRTYYIRTYIIYASILFLLSAEKSCDKIRTWRHVDNFRLIECCPRCVLSLRLS